MVMRTCLQPFNSTSARAVCQCALDRLCKKRPNHCRSRIGQMLTVLIRQTPIFRNRVEFIVAAEKDRAHVMNDDPVAGKTLYVGGLLPCGRFALPAPRKTAIRHLANTATKIMPLIFRFEIKSREMNTIIKECPSPMCNLGKKGQNQFVGIF